FLSCLATTAFYTLSLHDALPILEEALGAWNFAVILSPAAPGARPRRRPTRRGGRPCGTPWRPRRAGRPWPGCRPSRTRAGACTRSEEHTSELQSRSDLVCRLLLE